MRAAGAVGDATDTAGWFGPYLEAVYTGPEATGNRTLPTAQKSHDRTTVCRQTNFRLGLNSVIAMASESGHELGYE